MPHGEHSYEMRILDLLERGAMLRLLMTLLILLAGSAFAETLDVSSGELTTIVGTVRVPPKTRWVKREIKQQTVYAGVNEDDLTIAYMVAVTPPINQGPMTVEFVCGYAEGYNPEQKYAASDVTANVTDAATSFSFDAKGRKVYGWGQRGRQETLIISTQGGTKTELDAMVISFKAAPGKLQPPLTRMEAHHRGSNMLAGLCAFVDFLIFGMVAVLALIVRGVSKGRFNPLNVACNAVWVCFVVELVGLCFLSNRSATDPFSAGERTGYLMGGMTFLIAFPLGMVHFVVKLYQRAKDRESYPRLEGPNPC